MLVQTGLKPIVQKRIIWNIDHFNYFGFDGKVNSIVYQEFEVDIGEIGDIPQTKWKFDIWKEYGTSYKDPGNPRRTVHIKFGYSPLNAGITRGELKRTYHIIRASLIDSTGKGKWKSFQTDLEDLMDPKLDGQTIEIADFLKDSSFADLPIQADGSLIIEINFDICKKRIFDQAGINQKLNEMTIATRGNALGIGEFLKSQEHSDVKIIAKDGKEFYAHKIILRSNCEVFHEMLKSDTIESQTGVVKLDDLSAEGVNFLLHFVYNHTILPFMVDGIVVQGNGIGKGEAVEGEGGEEKAVDVDEVLHIASKYSLDPVIEFVDSKFRDLCNEENAEYLLGICEKHSLTCLNLVNAFITSQIPQSWGAGRWYDDE